MKQLFTKGNKAWQVRAKHGVDRIFATPEIMWQEACGYFDWCVKNPLYSVDFKGKDATEVKIPLVRAFTWDGLCMYLGVNTAYFRTFRNQLKENTSMTSEQVSDFNTVIEQISTVIRNQKFEAAAAGQLKENLISRDLGMVDKQEIVNINSVNMTKEEIKDISKLLDESL
jgi:hypothetical protein